MIEVSERLKELCQKDGVPKKIEITFPNNDYRTLTNDDVVAESMRFTENLCSATTFKFGYCEANVFEIKTLYITDVLTGKTIKPYVYYYDKVADEWLPMSLGVFVIDSHKRDSATPVKTLTAYGKEADLKLTSDIYRLYDISWHTSASVPNYAEYILTPTLFGKDKCDWFPWVDSVDYDNEWISENVWQKLSVINFIGFRYDAYYGKNIYHSWRIWLNMGREKIEPPASASTTSMYFSQATINQERIDNMLARLNRNIQSIYNDFSGGAPTTEHITMTNKDINNLIKHSHWLEKDSSDRYMRDLNGYSVVEGLNMNNWEAKTINVYPQCKSIGWLRSDFYVESSTGKTVVVGQESGEWVDVQTAGAPWEFLTDIKIERANESNMISIPDLVSGGKRVTPTWLEAKEEFRNFIEDYFELYACFGRTNREGKFEKLAIDSIFAKYCSEAEKIGSFVVSNGKNNYIVESNARAGAYFEDYVYQKIGTVIVDWLSREDGTDVQRIYELKFSDEPNTYYIQSNYFFNYVAGNWTRVENILRNCFIPHLTHITWRPMNITTPALPFVECGDIIRVKVGTENYDTFVHTRTIQGLQLLGDNFVSDMAEMESYDDIEITKSIIVEET